MFKHKQGKQTCCYCKHLVLYINGIIRWQKFIFYRKAEINIIFHCLIFHNQPLDQLYIMTESNNNSASGIELVPIRMPYICYTSIDICVILMYCRLISFINVMSLYIQLKRKINATTLYIFYGILKIYYYYDYWIIVKAHVLIYGFKPVSYWWLLEITKSIDKVTDNMDTGIRVMASNISDISWRSTLLMK